MTHRLDRTLTVYAAHPVARLSLLSPGIPILMYHSISDDRDTHSHPYYRTVTSVRAFRDQIEFLHSAGYTTLSLSDVIRSFTDQCGSKPVVVTFDDGFADFAEVAFPILHQFGFTATVFLPTRFISDSAMTFLGRPCLTWSQVRELHKGGITFGSHSITHRHLESLSHRELHHEIAGSKTDIEQHLGSAIDTFAYPFAFPRTQTCFLNTLRSALQDAGYQSGVCATVGTVNGTADPFFLARLPVNDNDDLRLFDAKLNGAYNWIGHIQYLSKWTKSLIRPPLSR